MVQWYCVSSNWSPDNSSELLSVEDIRNEASSDSWPLSIDFSKIGSFSHQQFCGYQEEIRWWRNSPSVPQRRFPSKVKSNFYIATIHDNSYLRFFLSQEFSRSSHSSSGSCAEADYVNLKRDRRSIHRTFQTPYRRNPTNLSSGLSPNLRSRRSIVSLHVGRITELREL